MAKQSLQLIILAPSLIFYAILRIVSYRVTNPRPYLLWHVLVDLGSVAILLAYAWWAARGI